MIATTGQGDFPGNARGFWKGLLKKKLGKETLRGVKYALVGVGDSSYVKFNWAARKLAKRVRMLGAEEVVRRCEADEQGDGGIDGDFLTWLQEFREAVARKFPWSAGSEMEVEVGSKWALKEVPAKGEQLNGRGKLSNGLHLTNGHHEASDKFSVVLEENKRVTPTSHWQDVRFLRLRASGYHEYLPGDALAISPENMPQEVETFLTLTSWQDEADLAIAIVPNDACSIRSPLFPLTAPLTLPNNCTTLRSLLTHHLDINAIPRRSFFDAIAKYTTDSMHKERLLEFTDPQYLDEYYDYATRPRRSIIEILQEFDSVKIPWHEAINVFPILRPRQFSIASGGSLKDQPNPTGGVNGTIFELLVAIVKYKTVIKRVREGVCTRYLAQLPIGTVLNVELKREGRFASRAEIAASNHLLIGAGTGIAPLRSLIHEKAALGVTGASTTLVFGGRNADVDYFFSDEWNSLYEMKLEVHTAFSRDQKEKFYVQDRIRDQCQMVSRLLHDPSIVIIVCGASGQMPKAVRQALVDVLNGTATQDSGPNTASIVAISSNEAEQFIARLEREGRYKQETWS